MTQMSEAHRPAPALTALNRPFWTSGAQSSQLLKDGEVDMIVMWGSRVAAVLGDVSLSGAAKAEFREMVRLLARRWARAEPKLE